MKMSFEETEALIGQILLAGKLCKVTNSKKEPILLYFSHPKRKDSILADYHYNEALIEAQESGLPSIEDMDKLLISRGFWGPEKEEEIESLESQIKGQKGILAKTTKVLARRERLENIINELEGKVRDIRREREVRLEHTAERKAEEEKMLYLSWSGILIPGTEERYWPTLADFKNETDVHLRNNASLQYTLFAIGTQSKKVRYIARSSSWVIRYMAAQKSCGRLFERDIYDFSVDQVNISYWSSFYASLHEMMPEDKPSEDVIEDDDALDVFMEHYFKQRQEEEREARTRKKGGKGSSALDHSEVLVMKSNPIYEDVDYSQTPNAKQKHQGAVEVRESKK